MTQAPVIPRTPARRRMAATVLAAACLAALGLGGCKDRASDTAVMGGYGPPRADASVPAPPAPRTATAAVARMADGEALAIWEEGGNVMVAHYWPLAGWQPAQALEAIGGRSSDPRIASNGDKVAMAVWRHTVGRIESLRYSRYVEGKGWTAPDVMPGALPRPRQPGKSAGGKVEEAAPRIEVDAAGHARAHWLSGFDETQLQVSTYVAGEGWSRPVDVPVAAAR